MVSGAEQEKRMPRLIGLCGGVGVFLFYVLEIKTFLGFVKPQNDGETENSTEYSGFRVLFS